MRVLLHDYGAYPFTLQLGAELAKRGYEVEYVYCGSVQTPGALTIGSSTHPRQLSVRKISLRNNFEKYSLARRCWQEIEYARKLIGVANQFEPDVIISANTPLIAQSLFLGSCRSKKRAFIFWLQDLLGLGAAKVVARKRPILRPFASFAKELERTALRRSDHVVAITQDFLTELGRAGVPPSRMSVIENWAPVGEMPLLPKVNEWSRRAGLHDRPVFLYAGTLGLKHDPSLLLALAQEFRGRPARVVVVSEGPGAEWLRDRKHRLDLDSLVVLPFQPSSFLPHMMATTDVGLALLEPQAGTMSVPSKVLTYLSAGRPVLAAIPASNAAARLVDKTATGLVVDPENFRAFVESGVRLLESEKLRCGMSAAAREYASSSFDIRAKADQFEHAMAAAAQRRSKGGKPARASRREFPALGLFLGPDKAGSTWFYGLAEWHPQAAVPSAKELFFFDRFYDRGTPWFENRFRVTKESRIAVEVCHDYLFSEDAARRIARSYPDARLVVCLRHPVERAVSAYQYMLRQGRTRVDFSYALRTIGELVGHARYGNHLFTYLKYFPKDQLAIVDFDALRLDPERVARGFFDHLGIDQLPIPDVLLKPRREAAASRFPALTHRGRQVGDLLRAVGFEWAVGAIKESQVIDRVLTREISGAEAVHPTLEDVRFIHSQLLADTEFLDDLLGTNYCERWWASAPMAVAGESS